MLCGIYASFATSFESEAGDQQSETNGRHVLAPLGFPLVRILPKGSHSDAGSFCSEILQEIDRIRLPDTAEDTR
jgi:hypothetical protein